MATRRRPTLLVGLLLLAMVVAVAWRLGDARKFAALAEQARPEWLLVALALQLVTYVCAGGVWWVSLRRSQPLATLVLLSVAKVFTDQALPSGGLSGTLLLVRAIVKRGTPRPDAAAALAINLLAYYASFAVAAAASLYVLSTRERTSAVLVGMAVAMLVVALAVVSALVALLRGDVPARWLARFRKARTILEAFADAPRDRILDPRVFGAAFALQLATIVLDGATLFASLAAVGAADAGLGVAFASFVFAMIAEVVGFVPGGLGTFEGTSVALLRVSGVGLERALAATLILRGLTFWIPMIPGFWLAHRELSAGEPDAPSAPFRAERS